MSAIFLCPTAEKSIFVQSPAQHFLAIRHITLLSVFSGALFLGSAEKNTTRWLTPYFILMSLRPPGKLLITFHSQQHSSNQLADETCLRTIELKENTVIIVLGASGDLAKKKTFPALFGLVRSNLSLHDDSYANAVPVSQQVPSQRPQNRRICSNEDGSHRIPQASSIIYQDSH